VTAQSPRTPVRVLLLLACLTTEARAQTIAFNTNTGALTALADFHQSCCGIWLPSATINGLTTGVAVGGGFFDGWAVAPLEARDHFIQWAFTGGPRRVERMQLLNTYGGNPAGGPHYIRRFSIDYTTDPNPTLGSVWRPVSILAFSGATANLFGNEVVVALPGGRDYRLTIDPVQATAIRLHSFPFAGISTNGNFVITEVSFETSAPDLAPPQVTITAPASGAVFGTDSVPVTAQVLDASACTVTSTPPGIAAAVPAGGGVAGGSVPLVEGNNVITVSAVDVHGNAGGASVTVVRDGTPPVLVVVSPAPGALLGDSPVEVSLQVQDLTAVTLTIAGRVRTLAPGGGSLLESVPLVEGPNTVRITAVDAAGNPGGLDLPLTLDSTAPVVTIDTPSNGAVFGRGFERLAVTATVNDLTATQVASTPPGVGGPLPAGGGIVTGTVMLAEGSNALSVRATDQTGRTGTASILVVLDTTPPDAAFVSPAAGSVVRGTVDVQVDATDPLPGSGVARVELSLDGRPLERLSNPPFEAELDTTTLVDGPHVLGLRALDGQGNAAVATIAFTVDNTPPVIAIVTPAPGAVVQGALVFMARASDAVSGLASFRMLAGGVAPDLLDGSVPAYETPVPADERASRVDTTRRLDGPLALSVRVLDAAGNEAFVELEVVVRNQTRSLLIRCPANGSVVRGTIPILAVADLPGLASIELLVDGRSIGRSRTSPFRLCYDTTRRLDGPMTITAIASDTNAQRVTSSIMVTVDNICFDLLPRGLSLDTRCPGRHVTARLEGRSLGLLLPTEAHAIELRVPGGHPVRALTGVGGDDRLRDRDRDGVPDLQVKFDRRLLIASIRAGIAVGAIRPRSNVVITLVAEDGIVLGTDTIRVSGRR